MVEAHNSHIMIRIICFIHVVQPLVVLFNYSILPFPLGLCNDPYIVHSHWANHLNQFQFHSLLGFLYFDIFNSSLHKVQIICSRAVVSSDSQILSYAIYRSKCSQVAQPSAEQNITKKKRELDGGRCKDCR